MMMTGDDELKMGRPVVQSEASDQSQLLELADQPVDGGLIELPESGNVLQVAKGGGTVTGGHVPQQRLQAGSPPHPVIAQPSDRLADQRLDFFRPHAHFAFHGAGMCMDRVTVRFFRLRPGRMFQISHVP